LKCILERLVPVFGQNLAVILLAGARMHEHGEQLDGVLPQTAIPHSVGHEKCIVGCLPVDDLGNRAVEKAHIV